MLRTTSNNDLGTQTSGYEEDQDATASVAGAGGASGGGSGSRSIKNLSITIKLAKSKKLDFAKANFGRDFLTPGAKKAFIHLRKAFTEASIYRHFDPERHVWIETNAS